MSKDYVTCWIKGRREFYDDYQQAFKENVPKKEKGSNAWLSSDNEMHFLFWHASHTVPPVRQEQMQLWKDVKTYESRLRSTYSEAPSGFYETTDELIEEYGEPKAVEICLDDENSMMQGDPLHINVLHSSYSCNEEAK